MIIILVINNLRINSFKFKFNWKGHDKIKKLTQNCVSQNKQTLLKSDIFYPIYFCKSHQQSVDWLASSSLKMFQLKRSDPKTWPFYKYQFFFIIINDRILTSFISQNQEWHLTPLVNVAASSDWPLGKNLKIK